MTAVASVGAQGVGVIAGLITVPLALGFLGSERYGLWVTIMSTFSMLSFLDLGLGNSLVTTLSMADGRNELSAASRYVSSATFVLVGAAGFVLLSLAVVYPLIPWDRLLNVSSPVAVREAGPAAAAFIVLFAFGLPANLAQRVQLGYQEGFAAASWLAIGNTLALVALLAAVHFRVALPWIVLAWGGGSLGASLLNAWAVFGRRFTQLRPEWNKISWKALEELLRLGGFFVLLQLSATVVNSAGCIVVAQLYGAEAVTGYSVTLKLFMLVPTIIGIVMSPLWPAYGEALARGDISWVKRTFLRSVATTLLMSGAASLFLLFFSRVIMDLWIRQPISPSSSLLGAAATWAVVSAAGNSAAMFLNGCGVVRLQAGVGSVMAATSVALMIGFGRMLGVAGVVWGTVVAYCVITGLALPLFWRRIVWRLERNVEIASLTDGVSRHDER